MPLITIENLDKSYPNKDLFENAGVSFFRGEKVGLIGANGSGKTTLFKMILGEETPDSGTINLRKGARVGYLPQEPVFKKHKTVIEIMHEAVAYIIELREQVEAAAAALAGLEGAKLESAMETYDRLNHRFELLGGYSFESRIRSILAGVGIGEELYDEPVTSLSGGQLSRLGLAQVLAGGADMLLLDEPTNHLDLLAIEWLEKYLRSYPGAAIIISHDRYLLEKTVVKIIELDRRQIRTWKGSYSQYLENKAVFELQNRREEEKMREKIASEQDFVDRNRNDVGMSKVARGRAGRLEQLKDQYAEQFRGTPADNRKLDFRFAPVKHHSHKILNIQDLAKSFDNINLFEGFSLEIIKEQRLAITGPNGTGKTTLLKMILDKLKPTAGIIERGASLTFGYMDQHGSELVADNQVIDEILRIKPEFLPADARNILGAFLFSGDDVFKKVSELSGGERSRLMLCRLVVTSPDVLILDEPTNHLDISSKEALENALLEYDGTIIAVSHDRYFIDKIATELLVMGTGELGGKQMGRLELIDADKQLYTRWQTLILERTAAKDAPAKKQNGPDKPAHTPKRQAPPEIKRFNKYRMEQIEEFIMDTEQRIVDIQAKFGDETVYKNHEKLAALQAELAEQKTELDLLYQAYEWKMG
ncbi:putative ABC transporter ATP-binding protein YheS [Limihaloglobus sulfuriphilus]|uniref:Putative ABC transporter ATP-binding protein YheS n=1 Tax=Limihaloglobus sulfuriphilus TaxID=1851148 RepID=A0A1R7T611_9BACT|nr:ABC-F family ATP-binding cassette domain-containing protein [Limihaloglobus sulfuriphilus]AQQ72123.1 putative ABC transporter ATP-binding protein YheS [Limihaloglobus sulfuriphilus]